MLSFLRKATRQTIDFHPVLERARDYPPQPAKQHLPAWFKEMDSYINGAPDTASWRMLTEGGSPFTVKRCVPVQDYLTSGYVIRTCVDIMLSRNTATDPEDTKWFLPTGAEMGSLFGMHPHGQCPVKFEGKNRHYIKIMSPWIIKTPPGYSTLFYQPFYLMERRFVLLPAIVDTDTYDHSIGFPGYMTDAEIDVTLPAGTPLMIALPFKRDDWQARVHDRVTSNDDSRARVKFGQHFANVYRNFFHSKKRFD